MTKKNTCDLYHLEIFFYYNWFHLCSQNCFFFFFICKMQSLKRQKSCMPLLFYLFYFIYIFMGVLYAYLVMRYLLLLIDISVDLATLVKNEIFFFFFLNNQIPQTILLVSKILKLFNNLTNRIWLNFAHWNWAYKRQVSGGTWVWNTRFPTLQVKKHRDGGNQMRKPNAWGRRSPCRRFLEPL